MNISKKIISIHPIIVVGFAVVLLISLGVVLFYEITPSRARSFEVTGSYVFSTYRDWPRSEDPKPNDTMRWYLSAMHQVQNRPLDTTPTAWRATEQVDINGDGLIDILHRFTRCDSNSCSSVDVDYYVLLNKGDLSFEVGYVCRNDGVWRGDCADI